ncbi:MAG: AraC family transcriptional regulator [Mastigocoleus sp. MO_167.B18]|uniref:helix-turn-helix domain-containing protein n=1 Tax=Mastigocoleus sp. MO_188.B34 TaxID=3036635 RepID=UPI002628AF69|nr:AraC family transcriptional regulator [Mastigocoleus sp. MO_188.B34]MDJ0695944.1 AraC family transcriptional regulator [Mastigocoleus sp. MO_188.B34]MDJ0773853.1 AraC family transcriptional regulator [Mastigocoleus sp. MO_167.B18]
MGKRRQQSFDLTQEKSLSTIFPRQPWLTSHELGWDGIQVQCHRQPAYEFPEMSCQQHAILVGTNTSDLTMDHTILGKRQISQVMDGEIATIPANVDNKGNCISTRDYDFIVLLLTPFQFANIAREALDCDCIELIPHFLQPDPLIHGIALAFKSELELQKQANQLYVDSLTTSLSIHLIKNYSTFKRSLQEYEGGLSRYKLKEVIEYINSHIDREIKLAELATMVDMSKYYFLRLFKQSMGVTPHQYLIQQRMEKAKQLLKQEKLSIVEVAAECGFSNQSHFAKVFNKNTGLTPRAYRKNR